MFAAETKADEPTASEQTQTTNFSKWSVTCRKKEETKKQACQLSQSKALKNKGPAIVLVSISSAGKSKNNYGVISVPLGIYLAPGVLVKVDKRRPFKILYEVCDKQSCHAGFKLSGPILSAFKRGNTASIFVYTAKKKAVAFEISLQGFSKAYEDYLKKEKGEL